MDLPQTIPLMQPPSGQTSDFHAKDLQPLLIGIHATFLSLMIIVLALRLYARGILMKNLWLEDYMAIFAAAVIIANSVLIFTLVSVGYGKHAWNIPLRNIVSGTALKRLTAVGFPYHLAIMFIKLSVAFLYWRIFRISSRWFRLATKAIIAFCLVFYLGLFAYGIASLTICDDINKALTNPNCGVGGQVVTWVGGIGNVITDSYLLALPIFPLAKLKLTKRKKFGIWILFSAGGLASAASIARLVTVVTLQGSKDFLYIAAVENVPTTIELCLGVVAASIPTLGKISESRVYHNVSTVIRLYTSSLSLIRRPVSSSLGSDELSVHKLNKHSTSI